MSEELEQQVKVMNSSTSHPGGLPPSEREQALERLRDLQADRALVGLSAAEEAELQLLQEELGVAPDESLEMAAAALDLALAPARHPMPVTLHNRVLASAEAFAADQRFGREDGAHELTLVGLPGGLSGGRLRRHGGGRGGELGAAMGHRRRDWKAWGGWVAAAAALGLAFVGWNRTVAPEAGPGVIGTMPLSAQVQGATLLDPVTLWNSMFVAADEQKKNAETAQVLDGLKSPEAETRVASLVAPDAAVGPPPIAGSMYWSDVRQQGVLVLTGLPPLQCPGDQYQLWITDALRDERYPVDGGLFRVEPGQKDVKITINPRVRVDYATQFTITRERAGGVVVSRRESVVAVGMVSRDDTVTFEPK